MNNNMRNYPAIARRFPELNALQALPATEANAIRTEAYRSLYDKLSIKERALADRRIKELGTMIRVGAGSGVGEQGAWELLVALAQAMEWADWPEKK